MTKKEFQTLNKYTLLTYNDKECRVISTTEDKVLVWMFHHCQQEAIPYSHLKVLYDDKGTPYMNHALSKFYYYIVVDGLIVTKRFKNNVPFFGTTEKKFFPGCVGEGFLYETYECAKKDAILFRKSVIKKHWVKYVNLM